VRIHAGAVIGADGFGYLANGAGHYKIPQLGGVEIGDDVEIGANTTIDRASTGVTKIGPGTKIDNLVQIGHNVQIGANCIIVSQVGLAGSCVLEDNVVVGGQAGVKEHARVGRASVVLARTGVIGDLPAGAYVSGFPARPHAEDLQAQAAGKRLPRLLRTVRELQRRLGDLERRNGDNAHR
jgi:UDP-3-O-[3-hydroxymyristoyl] glucosamine N-acyltransferase